MPFLPPNQQRQSTQLIQPFHWWRQGCHLFKLFHWIPRKKLQNCRLLNLVYLLWLQQNVILVHLCVYVCVCALKGKRLELSTPNFADIVYGRRPSACIDPEFKSSKVTGFIKLKLYHVFNIISCFLFRCLLVERCGFARQMTAQFCGYYYYCITYLCKC